MRSQYLARRIIRREMMLEELTRHSVTRRSDQKRRPLWLRLKALFSRKPGDQRSRVAM